ncbi:MAG TPA: sugar ABC transporter ATP-binding protein [Candidatus Limnocylindrales bacterium]|nr:sugar ABC transporter ATP-binding protein [Candidatus Limnocylindrales bacterium]
MPVALRQALVARGIEKRYPGVRALAGVDFEVDAREVHALLGENGAGKSTLMKIIAGAVVPDAGELLVDGEPAPFGSPDAARRAGIGIVYQELSLVPSLTVEENVLLGRWPGGAALVDWPALRAEARRHLEVVGLHASPAVPVRDLSMAERQLVEIAKALSLRPRVLLLDEPTSALSEPEARRLFDIIRDLARSGVAVIYVSHRLSEVMEIADRVTVLRDGRVVARRRTEDVDEAELARLLVGRDMQASGVPQSARGTAGGTVLRVTGLTVPPRLGPVDLELRAGEVVAVFGLVGSGRAELIRAIFGLEELAAGKIEIDGRATAITSPTVAIRHRLGYVAPDRRLGIVQPLSVAANISLASFGRLGRGPVIDSRAETALARQYVAALGVRVDDPQRPAGTLSGGNQQKVILGRWMCAGARVLLLDDATRGIDVGAKEEVFRLVRRLAEEGAAVLHGTSEIPEARAIGHRIVVMSAGRVAAEFDPSVSEEAIMAAAGGVRG